MVVAEDRIWVVSYHYFGYFDLETGGWERINRDDYTALALAPDGALWLGTRKEGFRRFTPRENGQGAGSWTYYFYHPDDIVSGHITTMVFAPDGSLWVGTLDGVARCVVQGE